MKNKIIQISLLLIAFNASAQTKELPQPKDGIEGFTKELVDNIAFPELYHENGGLTLRILVDSLSNVKLLTLRPYDAHFYTELKSFVENTEWTAGTIDGMAQTQVVSLPLKLNGETEATTQKPTPKIGLYKFYDGMFYTVKTSDNIIWEDRYQAMFTVTKEGTVKNIDIFPVDGNKDTKASIRSYLEKSKWNPAVKNGKAVDASMVLPIKIRPKRR